MNIFIVIIDLIICLVCGFAIGFGYANYRHAVKQLKMIEKLARQDLFPRTDDADWWKQGDN